jgi:aspartokinase/homoserine dehydrogenase 1
VARTEVHKFGGTSVGDADRIVEAAARLLDSTRAGVRIVAVSSAMAGVTDALLDAVTRAAGGDGTGATAAIDALETRHRETLQAVHPGGDPDAAASIDGVVADLRRLTGAAALLGEVSPRVRDRVLSCGEKLAVRLLAVALMQAGARAVPADADGFLETDDRFGEADPLPVVADRAIRAHLAPLLAAGTIPVVTGFCGRAPDGATTTLGRGGSDLSATFLAAALGADEVTIWTDVDGVLSADPSTVPEARVLRHLHYREAAELSYYGAKVLHQRSMIPVVGRGIPVRIRNSFRPEATGTLVDGRFTPGSHPVKAISAVQAQALVSVEGKGMAGVPGVAARVFGALAARRISVTMISQSSSESSICLAVPTEDATAAEAALRGAFRTELSRGDVEELHTVPGVALVAAVGLGMAHVPGIAARVFGALARARVNVLAIAQGSSELNISLAIDQDDAAAAVAAIHREFGLHRIDTGEDRAEALDVLLLGFGNIGRAFAELVATRALHARERFGVAPRIVGACDRTGFLFAPRGLDDVTLARAAEAKRDGRGLATVDGAVAAGRPGDLLRHALQYRLSRPVLVDVSDADDADALFREALGLGCDVVTANKKPLAGPVATFRALQQDAATHARLLKCEATVGAGLPVVDTLEMLLATGDRLHDASGCLSGTLAFLTMRLEEGRPLSEAVAEAVRLGYTEPDPVADLSGMDVLRKAIILGRLSGLAGDDAIVEREGLVADDLAGTPVDALLDALRADYDVPMARRLERARDEGRVLRYVARVRPGRITVGPEAVDPEDPLGSLRGTDNRIVFRSERYAERPLVVTGPGAGVDVTAMGVLGDVLRIAAERAGGER